MITTVKLRGRELDRTPDLVELVSAARDGGHEVMLIERPMPEAVSVAAIGRALDIVATADGVALEDATGRRIDVEAGGNRILAAARIWQRIASSDAIAVGGFAYRPDRDPAGAWSGFPALLFRVPALAVVRKRGRTFVVAATPDAEELLELTPSALRAPAARTLDVSPARNPLAWTAAVESAAARLRAGSAEKVVLAREVVAHGDGVVSAGAVMRALRAAYPSCFNYLIAGADGTAFATEPYTSRIARITPDGRVTEFATPTRDAALGVIQPWLTERGIYSRGRFGSWKYEIGNMDHAVKMGVDVARRVVRHEPEELWSL